METFLASGGLLEDLGINLLVLGTQVVVFVFTFIVLSRLLFGRILGHMTRREEEVRSRQEAVERDLAEVAVLAKDYEARKARIDSEADKMKNDLVRKAIAECASEVAQAQAEAQEEVRKGRDAIAAEKREALAGLRVEVERLTFAVAEKVMESRIDPAVHGPVVRKFLSERS